MHIKVIWADSFRDSELIRPIALNSQGHVIAGIYSGKNHSPCD